MLQHITNPLLWLFVFDFEADKP